MRYLDPKADLTFKKVFGEHPDLVMSFLNALLPFDHPGDEITAVEYLPAELVPQTPLRKNSIVDVRCRDNRGRQFIVEMQMVWSPEFKQRVLFNASKAYVRQLGGGEDYDLLQPVYSLNLKPHNYSDKRMMTLWLRYLTEIGDKTSTIPDELLADPAISKAVGQLEESAFSEAQLLGYEKFWDVVSVEKTLVGSAERKGRREGVLQTARKLKQLGVDAATIGAATGLSADEVAAL